MSDDEFMRDVLQRIATGPTLSKDLSRLDAVRAMDIILSGKADEVQAGIFLIALRMKRETDDELAGILDAINDRITPLDVAVDELICIVDPYDGYLRGVPAAPFLPAVLAACGQRVLTHGVASMGPKFGATHQAVLAAAGCQLPASREAAVIDIENSSCGWAYLVQEQLAPELAALTQLRTRIVKRPCLTTIEVALRSLVPTKSLHLVTGFVHKPYPPIYAKLAQEGGFSSSILVRGVEGGVVPSLTQPARYFVSTDGESLSQVDIEPADVGIEREERVVPLPIALQDDSLRSVKSPDNPFAGLLAKEAAQLGLAALAGEPGYTYDSLVYAGAVILHGRGLVSSMSEGAATIRRALDDGSAQACFLAASTTCTTSL